MKRWCLFRAPETGSLHTSLRRWATATSRPRRRASPCRRPPPSRSALPWSSLPHLTHSDCRGRSPSGCVRSSGSSSARRSGLGMAWLSRASVTSRAHGTPMARASTCCCCVHRTFRARSSSAGRSWMQATVRAMVARPRPPRRLSRRCSMRCATRARAGAAQRSCCYRQPRTPTPRRARRSEASPRSCGRSVV